MGKRILALLLALVTLLSLTACKKKPVVLPEPTQQTEQTEQPTQPQGEQSTELQTAQPTGPPPEETTEAPPETPTQPPTEQATQASTEKPTQPPTEQATQVPTEKPTQPPTQKPVQSPAEQGRKLDEDGSYTSKEDVALYIHTYGHLPSNFITKREAEALGWTGGSLEPYAPGKSIGGSYFGNYEGQLPKKKGRTYTECDIDTQGKKKRGAKRIVFSNDGLIYYTEDHYETFELLYGEVNR